MKEELFIGIDVGGTTAKIGIINRAGELIEKTQVNTLKTNNWKEIIDEYLIPVKKWQDSGYNIKGIGIGTPGLVNKNTGVVQNCENIPGLKGASFVQYIKDKTKLHVIADNDATCAAIGEHIFGAGKEYSDFLLVTLGTGIGGGIILNNKVYRGIDGYAGELGHMIIVAEGHECSCGNRGCIEAYSSATSIIKKVQDGIKKGYITTYSDEEKQNINAKMIFEKAVKGDSYSLDAIDNAARYLGRMIGSLVNLLNLQCVVIGGGIAASGNFFIERVQFYCNQVAWHLFTINLKIIPARLLNDAGILGAASLILEEELEKESH